MTKLSILIPTVVGRESNLELLLKRLNILKCHYRSDRNNVITSEYSISEHVECVTMLDNKQLSIGQKRQNLLEFAMGEYIVFIDDDDLVPERYSEKIIQTILESNPDSIGFKIECSINGVGPYMASASNQWNDWAEDEGGFKYVRTPYQKTPIKKEIALQIGYKDMRFGEDYDYSKRLKQSGLIKSEIFIPEILYYYNYKHEDPRKKYGITN